MYALVDCNNFYASCERLFQPHLNGQPVVVLSNNDGCVIARSDEAKELGVVMGTPAYMFDDFFKQHNVAVYVFNAYPSLLRILSRGRAARWDSGAGRLNIVAF